MCISQLLAAKRAVKVASRLSCPPADMDANWKRHQWTLYACSNVRVARRCLKENQSCFLSEKKPQEVLESKAINLPFQFLSIESHQLKFVHDSDFWTELWSLYMLSAWILESGDLSEVAHCSFLEVSQTQFMYLYLYLYTILQLTYISSYHLDFNSGTQRWTSNNSISSFCVTVLRCNTQ